MSRTAADFSAVANGYKSDLLFMGERVWKYIKFMNLPNLNYTVLFYVNDATHQY